MIYKGNVAERFEGAKRRARSRVKGIVPANWSYTIQSYDKYNYDMTTNARSQHKVWWIQFQSNIMDLPSAAIEYRVCSEDFHIDNFNYSIIGKSWGFDSPAKDPLKEISIIFSYKDQIKKCVEEIIKEMNPTNFTQVQP